MKTQFGIFEITHELENTGTVKFKRQPRANDNNTHIAEVKDSLVVVDDEITMTWDSFTYLYLEGFPIELEEKQKGTTKK